MENRQNTRLFGDYLTIAGPLTPQVGHNKLVGNSMQYYKIVGNSESQGAVAPQPIDGWETFLGDGEGYLRTAVNAHQKQKKVFTAEILYNMVAMAIEKLCMAALMRHGTMPMNHSCLRGSRFSGAQRHPAPVCQGRQHGNCPLQPGGGATGDRGGGR